MVTDAPNMAPRTPHMLPHNPIIPQGTDHIASKVEKYGLKIPHMVPEASCMTPETSHMVPEAPCMALKTSHLVPEALPCSRQP